MVGLGMQPGLATVTAQIGRHRGPQDELVGIREAGTRRRSRKGSAMHHRASALTMNASMDPDLSESLYLLQSGYSL